MVEAQLSLSLFTDSEARGNAREEEKKPQHQLRAGAGPGAQPRVLRCSQQTGARELPSSRTTCDHLRLSFAPLQPSSFTQLDRAVRFNGLALTEGSAVTRAAH